MVISSDPAGTTRSSSRINCTLARWAMSMVGRNQRRNDR
jgi:hypothetical protein